MPIEDTAFCRPLLVRHVGKHTYTSTTVQPARNGPSHVWLKFSECFPPFPRMNSKQLFPCLRWWMEDTGRQTLACQAKSQSQRHIRKPVRVTGAKIVYWKSFIAFIVHKSSMAHPGPVETHYWSASLLCPRSVRRHRRRRPHRHRGWGHWRKCSFPAEVTCR